MMKAKTINSIITAKFDAWHKSIKDPKVAALAKGNMIVTGGCIASMLLNEQVNDFDMYARNKETTLALANYYVELFKKNPPPTYRGRSDTVNITVTDTGGIIAVKVKSAGIASEEGDTGYEYFEMDPGTPRAGEYVDRVLDTKKSNSKAPYRPTFLTSNAITLSDNVQFILRFYGEPDELHGNYDYAHCMNYWDSNTRSLTLRPAAVEAILTKELRYVGSLYPVCSIIRSRKFIARGWTINAGQYLKMIMQCKDLNLNDPFVLKDQLLGVDVAYFNEVLRLIKERGGDRIDSAYLIEIIDKVF